MKFNPQIHHRRSIRLKGYDYSKAGAYFITICCHEMKHRFGEIMSGAGLAPAQMILNEYGQIAYAEWTKLERRFFNFELDVFQIMPNHMHGIIVLKDDVEGKKMESSDADANIIDGEGAWVNRARTAPSIGDIVGAYKSLVANGCLEIFKSNHERAGLAPAQFPMMGKLWHRNYYENIIRDEHSYINISNYIINNPAKWNEDKFFKK